jgi:hypothetical protein
VPSSTGLLSCFSAPVATGALHGKVALLVAADHPGRLPAVLPGSRRVRQRPGVNVSPAADPSGATASVRDRLYSTRVGDAWLVLETSAPATAAAHALARLTVPG